MYVPTYQNKLHKREDSRVYYGGRCLRWTGDNWEFVPIAVTDDPTVKDDKEGETCQE